MVAFTLGLLATFFEPLAAAATTLPAKRMLADSCAARYAPSSAPLSALKAGVTVLCASHLAPGIPLAKPTPNNAPKPTFNK